MKQKPMNYFAAITHCCNELDRKGQAYLDTLPFMSNPDILDRLWQIANAAFDKIGRDWNRCDEIPEWASNFLDGWIPFAPPSSGSLFCTIGFSAIANDANLRNLLERAEGRTDQELSFGVMVDKNKVAKLAGLPPEKD